MTVKKWMKMDKSGKVTKVTKVTNVPKVNYQIGLGAQKSNYMGRKGGV